MGAALPAATGAANMVADRLQAKGTELVGDVELLTGVIGGRGALPLAAQLVAEVGASRIWRERRQAPCLS